MRRPQRAARLSGDGAGGDGGGRANAAGCVPRCRWAASAERAAARGRRAPHDHAGCSLQSSPPAAPRASRRRPAAAGGRHQRSQQHPVQLKRPHEPSRRRTAAQRSVKGAPASCSSVGIAGIPIVDPASRRYLGGRAGVVSAVRRGVRAGRPIGQWQRRLVQQRTAARCGAAARRGIRPPPAAARAPQPGRGRAVRTQEGCVS